MTDRPLFCVKHDHVGSACPYCRIADLEAENARLVSLMRGQTFVTESETHRQRNADDMGMPPGNAFASETSVCHSAGPYQCGKMPGHEGAHGVFTDEGMIEWGSEAKIK